MAEAKKDAEEAKVAEATAPPPPVVDAIVRVTFTEQWALYGKGETAGFPADKAAWLIKQNVAVAAA
jgi:hypothetical protein